MALQLAIDDLKVTSFQTATAVSAIAVNTDPVGCCCTGCDSGCGIIPTGGGCESQGDPTAYCTYDFDCAAEA